MLPVPPGDRVGARVVGPRPSDAQMSFWTLRSPSLVAETVKSALGSNFPTWGVAGGALPAPSSTLRQQEESAVSRSIPFACIYDGASEAARPLPVHARRGGGQQPLFPRGGRQVPAVSLQQGKHGLARCSGRPAFFRFPRGPWIRGRLFWQPHRSFHLASPRGLATCSRKACAPRAARGSPPPPRPEAAPAPRGRQGAPGDSLSLRRGRRLHWRRGATRGRPGPRCEARSPRHRGSPAASGGRVPRAAS